MRQIESGTKSLDRLVERLASINGWVEVRGKRYPSNNPHILNEICYLLTSGEIEPSDIAWQKGAASHLEFLIYDGVPTIYSEELFNIGNEINEKYNAFRELRKDFIDAVENGEYVAPDGMNKDNRAFGNAVKEFAKTRKGGRGGLTFSFGGKRESTEQEEALTRAAESDRPNNDGADMAGVGVKSLDDIMFKLAKIESGITVKGKDYPSNIYVINEINYLLNTGDLTLDELSLNGKNLKTGDGCQPQTKIKYKANKRHIKADVSNPVRPWIYSNSLIAMDNEMCKRFRELKQSR
ncbi:MAG: hypothetical protein LBI17_03945 [Rickettsiales bacterium]|jgi:hypothetical protein|nr:hypothetical protein [Rickettsiales bacterium]